MNIRRLIYLLSTLLLVAAGALVPLPYAEFAPGSAESIGPLLELDTATTPLDGDFRLLTVAVSEPAIFDLIRAAIDDHIDIGPRSDLIPPGVQRREFFRSQAAVFDESVQLAIAVGARAAGQAVEVAGAVGVVTVLEGGPADGVLQPGDVIVALDGDPVVQSEQLSQRTADIAEGTTVTLTIERDADVRDVEVTLARARGMQRAGIGITIENVDQRVTLPFTATTTDTGIGGPSAGMMVALTVYDLLSRDDLLRGRNVAGTGTIGLDGTVGTIGGIEQKVVAAERAGVTFMLVPAPLLERAQAASSGTMDLVGVRTIEDAIAALLA